MRPRCLITVLLPRFLETVFRRIWTRPPTVRRTVAQLLQYRPHQGYQFWPQVRYSALIQPLRIGRQCDRLSHVRVRVQYLQSLAEGVTSFYTNEVLGCRYPCLFSARVCVYLFAGIQVKMCRCLEFSGCNLSSGGWRGLGAAPQDAALQNL